MVLVFTYIHNLCIRAAKAHPSLRICACLSELSMLDSAITVNLEVFARILFSQIVLKGIFAIIEIRDKEMVYLHQEAIVISLLVDSLIFTKISKFTVVPNSHMLACV